MSLITLSQWAKANGVSRQLAHLWAERGAITVQKTGGKHSIILIDSAFPVPAADKIGRPRGSRNIAKAE